VDRFWDRGLVHIAFGDRIVRHCHRLCRSTGSIVILDAMRSVRINRRIQILSDMFQGPNRLANNHASPSPNARR
jgi:hypothetical protein